MFFPSEYYFADESAKHSSIRILKMSVLFDEWRNKRQDIERYVQRSLSVLYSVTVLCAAYFNIDMTPDLVVQREVTVPFG